MGCPPVHRALALGTSRAWRTAGCGMRWSASSTYLLTCRWNSHRYCGLSPVRCWCEMLSQSPPLGTRLWMWLLGNWMKTPCILGLTFNTKGLSGRQAWTAPDRLLHGRSFLPGVPQPALFITASMSALHGAHPFASLSLLCQFTTVYQPCLTCRTSACLSNSHVLSLSPLLPPPSPSLSFLLTPHLSGKMNQTRSEHLLWTNKWSVM